MLRIFVVSHNGSPPVTPVSAVFGNGEGSIGRDAINTLVLEESDKHLSRVQALIKCLGGEYFLLDQGGNPSLVNGRPVGKGKVATLRPGDKIKMAGWVLQVAPVASVTQPVQRAADSVADTPKGASSPGRAGVKPVAEYGTATVLMQGDLEQVVDSRSWGSPSDFLRDYLQESVTAEPQPDGAQEKPGEAAAIQEAFLRGLGITATADWRLSAQQAELLGALLRASMEGFQRLLKEQALSRKALLPAQDTADAEGPKNPLKTSADAAIALHRMLFQPEGANALAPLAAVRDAVLELHAHHAGVSLGLRGAMAGMLTAFKPEILEKRLCGNSVDEAGDLWQRYVQSHPEIARKAEDVFHVTLVQAYRRVYEDQKSRQIAGRTAPQ